MRILITGAAGFIGANLAEYFLARGDTIIGLDNFITGRIENILPLFSQYPDRFHLIVGDIRDFSVCQKAATDCEIILHHAALGSVPRSIDNPRLTNSINIDGFLNMLVAARDASCRRFIYAASSSTYGDSAELPKVENRIGRPLSPYAVTKYVNELYADVFAKTYGIETIGLRYFNVFGRRQDPNGAYAAVIPKFISQFIAYENSVINGDGEYSRDFTYIDNVIQMNELAIAASDANTLNQIYNTAGGERTTLNQLAEYLREFLGEYDPAIRNVQIEHRANRAGDIPHSHACIDKAKKMLGYQPRHNFRDGLRETVKWYWEQRAGKR